MNVDSTTVIIGTGLFGLAAVIWVLCAYLAYQTAPKRGRRAGTWAALAIIFGPLALFALYVMKPKSGQPGSSKRHDPRADLYEVPRKK